MHPKEGDPVQRVIANNPTFSPFFDNCISALDGVHIHAFVGTAEHSVLRDRMKNISQNDFFLCVDWLGRVG